MFSHVFRPRESLKEVKQAKDPWHRSAQRSMFNILVFSNVKHCFEEPETATGQSDAVLQLFKAIMKDDAEQDRRTSQGAETNKGRSGSIVKLLPANI